MKKLEMKVMESFIGGDETEDYCEFMNNGGLNGKQLCIAEIRAGVPKSEFTGPATANPCFAGELLAALMEFINPAFATAFGFAVAAGCTVAESANR